MSFKGKLVYVASPYSSPDKALQEYRFVAVAIACAWVINNHSDFSFFSPITHTHPIAAHGRLPGHWQFWAAYDQCMLSRCNEVWVLCLEGWRQSSGVTAELKIAGELEMRVRYIIPQPPDSYKLVDKEPA